MNKKMDTAELRRNHKLLLLKNRNYFGNLTKAGLLIDGFLEPVFELISDTYYEELTCVSFNPATNELWAVVRIKQETGYSGGPCTDGSKEYVRFYVDYNRDGTWVDEGAVNFDAHDLPFDEVVAQLQQRGIEYYLEIEKESHHPITRRLGIKENLDEYFELIRTEGNERLYRLRPAAKWSKV